LPTDRKPEAYTFVEGARRIAELSELLEDSCLLLFIQSAAVVHNCNAGVVTGTADLDPNFGRLRMDQGIVEVIAHKALEQHGVGMYRAVARAYQM
jgi:hypothetical protein